MKIDSYDNTLICEDTDVKNVLLYIKDYRLLPEYIEMLILKIIAEQADLTQYSLTTVDEFFENVDKVYMKKIIENINIMFFNDEPVLYDQKYLSYLLYYLPSNVFKIWKPLMDLMFKNTLKPSIRVLDVGTGPGSVPIGIIEYYKALAEKYDTLKFSISFVLIDGEEDFLIIATKMIEGMTPYLPKNLIVKIESTLSQKIEGDDGFEKLGEFDIITMSNFLTSNESGNQQNSISIISELKNNTKSDGAFIIIEPGDKKSCMSLKKTRNEINERKILNVFSPCVGIWEEKETYDCSCFNMVRCYWEVPNIYKYLIKFGLNKGKRIDVPFNYLVLRNDNIKKNTISKNRQYFTMLNDLKWKDGQTVNIKGFIRTVIYNGDKISISICDGLCSFRDDNDAIWVYTSNSTLKKKGIDMPLVSAEIISLKKVNVKVNGNRIILSIMSDTGIIIDY